MRVLSVVGARPNFMKVAPLTAALTRRGHESRLVHTGQHYDDNMSAAFFRDLRLPEPDHYLGVGSGSHAQMTAAVMTAFEPILIEEKPDVVVVVGDVNSTVACTLVATKMHVPVAHVEAGLRSRDRTMPEEINRLVTDAVADLLLTPSPDADENLRAEGVPAERIHFVGNIMIDALAARFQNAPPTDVIARLGLEDGKFGVVTLHRPSNVDDPATLQGIVDALVELSAELPLVFPCHPRTRSRLQIDPAGAPQLHLTEPLGYFDFSTLVKGSRLVLTDSGGLQEETTWHGIPCVTIRENTERPITITAGSNVLAGNDPRKILELARAALQRGEREEFGVPELWDGRTADRIVDVLEQWWAVRS